MINAPTHNIRPDRSLAALALTRTESAESADSALVEYSTANSGLGDIGGLPVSGPMLPPTRPDSVMGDGDGNGNLEKVKDDDAGSDTSTTPMDLTADDDVKGATATIPKAPSRPPPIPPRPKASADQGFKKVEEVARQQDAAEILNNVYDLLSCAFQGHSTLEDGEQGDLIKDLFFSGVTTVREKDGKKAIKTDLQDNILVSTQDRDRKLCAALDDEFGLTELDSDGMTKFELFDKAAPILEFNVRRLQYENDRVRKDESHLELDKVLYLDRYLKKTSSRSEAQLQELRNQQWSLQKELRQLEERRKTLKETEFGNVDLLGVLDEAAVFTATAGKELSPPASDAAEPESEGLDDALNQRAADLRPEVEKIESRMQELEREIDTVFEDCKDHAYYLHAIFIHAGGANSGHYWIYIYDFQNEYWRSYNDETVKLEDEETIFRKVERAHPPTSTGIVYVRADVRKEYTEAVCRNPENVNVEMKDAEPANAETEFENIPVLDGVPTE
jgi:ubiquitin carboxyl-terminal hydrolase 25/28